MSLAKISPELKALLRACASNNHQVSAQAKATLAGIFQKALNERMEYRFEKGAGLQRSKSLELPLKQGILNGDVISDLFEMIQFENGVQPEWPMDFVSPGSEGDFRAYTMPGHGKIPEFHVEGTYVTVPTYPVSASIDYDLDYFRDARWDIASRAMEVLDMMVTRKLNDDGWATLLAAVFNRNILVFDNDAAQGQFTKRLISLMKSEMRRQGKGNTASLVRKRLTDLYISVEALEDIRNWGVDQLDEISRREIFVAEDGSINRIFNVNLHDMDEFGVGQIYQKYYTDVLGGTLQASDVELVIGLDLQRNDSLVMPVRDGWEVHEDPTLQRRWEFGLFGRMRVGFGVLDDRVCIAGSF